MAGHQNDGLKQLVADGISAIEAGTQAGKESVEKITTLASHPDLKAALAAGAATTEGWTERLDALRQSFDIPRAQHEGGFFGAVERTVGDAVGGSGTGDNRIVDAIYRTSQQISDRAEDDQARDLGIIASGQIALHYYIAAFGTIANYVRALGHDKAAAAMSLCVAEAKEADEAHTRLANQLIDANAMA